jgi:hypothetical protein
MIKPLFALSTLLTILAASSVVSAGRQAQADEAGQAEEALVVIEPAAREVRVRGEALRVDMPLEFICVVTGTADHEALLRTRARPSVVHAALLAIGLEPGRPLRFNEAAGRWLAPEGPPMKIEIEWEQDGEVRRERVGRLIRNIRTGQAMPQRRFVFVGSQMVRMRDGRQTYAADGTGQIVSLVNFEYPIIDVAELASNANETLEWETDPATAPPAGTPVTMILSPIGGDAPATRPAGDVGAPVNPIVVKLDRKGRITLDRRSVTLDELRQSEFEPERPARVVAVRELPMQRLSAVVDALRDAGITQIDTMAVDDLRDVDLQTLRDRWRRQVLPQADALRTAAQTHYEVMQAYQDRINALLEEADELRREMEELQEQFDELTTPQPTVD